MINTDRTGLQQQAGCARLLSELIHTATGHGARTIPSFHVTEFGTLEINIHYTGKPVEADLAAWNLTLGPLSMDTYPYNVDDEWRESHISRTTVDEVTVRFCFSHPYTPVGLKVVR